MKTKKNPYIVKLFLWSLLALIFVVGAIASAETPSSGTQSDPKTKLILRLQKAFKAGDQEEIRSIKSALLDGADSTISAIQKLLPACEKDVKIFLISIIMQTPGTEATRYLIDLACTEDYPSINYDALSAVGNRQIDFKLTEQHVDCLKIALNDPGPYRAYLSARILSRSNENNQSDLASLILERFRKQIIDKSPLPSMESGFSPRVHILNQYLLSFRDLGKNCIPKSKEMLREEKEKEVKTWLTLALGIAGDSSVVYEIENILKNDSDPYVRAAAVNPYAVSAGKDAIPLLQSLLTDAFISEYSVGFDGTPIFIIRYKARDALVDLGVKF